MTTETPTPNLENTPATATSDKEAPAQVNGQDASLDHAGEQASKKTAVEEDPNLPMKVFAGNLSFQTTEETLRAHFEKFGNIKDVSIVRVNHRHLGYGFVTFETVAEAEKAIAENNKTTLQEREINVQSARSKADTKRRPRKLNKKKYQKKQPTSASTTPGSESEKLQGDEKSAETKATESDQSGKPGKARASKPARQTRKPRQPRAQRQRGPPSEDTVFVANIPYSTTDESLGQAFTEAGLQVASAHVVHHKGRMLHRSKGFGFVVLASHEDQCRAVEVMHGKQIEGRPVSVRIAFERVEETAQQTGEGAEDESGDVTATEKEGTPVTGSGAPKTADGSNDQRTPSKAEDAMGVVSGDQKVAA